MKKNNFGRDSTLNTCAMWRQAEGRRVNLHKVSINGPRAEFLEATKYLVMCTLSS